MSHWGAHWSFEHNTDKLKDLVGGGGGISLPSSFELLEVPLLSSILSQKIKLP